MTLGLFGSDEQQEEKELEQIVNDAKDEISELKEEIQIDEKIVEEARDAESKLKKLEAKEEEIENILQDLSNSSSASALELAQNPEKSEKQKREVKKLSKDLSDSLSEARTLDQEIADIENKIKQQININEVAEQEMQETAQLIKEVEKHQSNAEKTIHGIETKLENTNVSL